MQVIRRECGAVEKKLKGRKKEKLQARSAGRLPDSRRERERERAHLGNDDGT
jgi:hypothetical protein